MYSHDILESCVSPVCCCVTHLWISVQPRNWYCSKVDHSCTIIPIHSLRLAFCFVFCAPKPWRTTTAVIWLMMKHTRTHTHTHTHARTHTHTHTHTHHTHAYVMCSRDWCHKEWSDHYKWTGTLRLINDALHTHIHQGIVYMQKRVPSL